jgi:hypothetical protein
MVNASQLELCSNILDKLIAEPTFSGAEYIGLTSSKGEIVKSTVDHYVNGGLRGARLRSAVAKDCGFGPLFWAQLILITIQIVYWIKELMKQKES